MKKLGIGFLAFGTVWIVLQWIPPRTSEGRSVLEGDVFRIAHRCGKHVYPENTLFACKQIRDRRMADFLEFDFHLTKDGVPVVIHDDFLERTTNGKGLVREKNWEEISQLDAGYHFTPDQGLTYPYRGKGIRLNTLEDFFRELKSEKLMVEIKPDSTEAADILLDLIEAYKLQDRIIVGSFHQRVKDYLVEKKPELAFFASKQEVILWVLLEKVGLSHLYRIPSQTMALPPRQSILVLNSELIRKLHSQNVKVYVWTINDRESLEYWKNEGVDGVMTDDPRLFESIF